MDGMKVTMVDQTERPKPPMLSIGDLTRQCNEAASKMSNSNPNKVLILNCAYAMQQLVKRLSFHEGAVKQ